MALISYLQENFTILREWQLASTVTRAIGKACAANEINHSTFLNNQFHLSEQVPALRLGDNNIAHHPWHGDSTRQQQ
jgi:hypothetical protein